MSTQQISPEQRARIEARAEAYEQAMQFEPVQANYELVCLGEVSETSVYLRVTEGEIDRAVLADSRGAVIECRDLDQLLEELAALDGDVRPVLDRLEEWLPVCPRCAAEKAEAGPSLRELYAEGVLAD